MASELSVSQSACGSESRCRSGRSAARPGAKIKKPYFDWDPQRERRRRRMKTRGGIRKEGVVVTLRREMALPCRLETLLRQHESDFLQELNLVMHA